MVVLGIASKGETVVLLSLAQSIDLPKDQACFAFIRSSGRIVYVYSCPATSPVRSRMLYSSSSRGVVNRAEAELGLTIVKRLQTSDPQDITPSYIASEIDPSSAAKPEAATFSRPKRPGRK